MKKLLSIILCLVMLLCLFSCNQAPDSTETRAPTEKPTEKKQFNGDYHELYENISVGGTYEHVVDYMGAEGTYFRGITKEWDVGGGKFLHVTFDTGGKEPTVKTRAIYYVEKSETTSSSSALKNKPANIPQTR